MPIFSIIAGAIVASILIAVAFHVGLDVRWSIAFVPLYLVIAAIVGLIVLFIKSGVGPQ